jgi:hypothetical protein
MFPRVKGKQDKAGSIKHPPTSGNESSVYVGKKDVSYIRQDRSEHSTGNIEKVYDRVPAK